MALLSRVMDHRILLQMIVDRSKLLERENYLSDDLALILVYDQIFGTRVRGKFKVRGEIDHRNGIDQFIHCLGNVKTKSNLSRSMS